MVDDVLFLSSHLLILFLWIFHLSTPTGVETPDVIDLRKQQRKEPERPLYQVRIFSCCFSSVLTSDLTCYVSFCCFLCRYLKRRKKKLLLELCLEPHTRMQYLHLPFFYYLNIIGFPSIVFLLSCHVYSLLCSYVVGTGAQDKSGAKRVRLFYVIGCI